MPDFQLRRSVNTPIAGGFDFGGVFAPDEMGRTLSGIRFAAREQPLAA
jgi:hypothetical protein